MVVAMEISSILDTKQINNHIKSYIINNPFMVTLEQYYYLNAQCIYRHILPCTPLHFQLLTILNVQQQFYVLIIYDITSSSRVLQRIY